MKFKKETSYVSTPNAKLCSLTKEDYSGYKKCEIELPVNDLVIERGTHTSNKTILYLQGGPNVALADGRNNIMPEGQHFYNMFKDDQFLHVKEMQHLKYSIGASKVAIPLDDAVQEQLEYIDILERIVLHYKDLGREVILIGYSYGALIVNEFIRIKGTIADKTYSIGGRLNSDIQAYSTYTPQQLCLFGPENTVNRLIDRQENLNTIAFLVVTLAAKKNTELINTSKIDKNKLCFVTVEMDEQVGWFNDVEKKWAQQHSNLLYVDKKRLRNIIMHEQSLGRIKKEEITDKILLHWAHYIMFWNSDLLKEWLNIL